MPERWVNWARDQRCAPARLVRPADEGELVQALAGAGRVKVAGSGHSFTDIACTDGVLVDMRAMRRVLEVDGHEVTVEAGITLRELGAQLRARGLAMENQGDVDPQTLAGALATATHGTGGRFGNLSSRVTGVRLVGGDGELHELREGRELRAARVSLGALGAISAVTLGCVPAFTVHRLDEPRPLDDVLPRLDELVDSNDHWEAFVMPYTRRALTLSSERTDREPRPPGRVQAFARDVLLENAVLGLFCRAGRVAPALIPWLNRRLASLLGRAEQLDASNRVYANTRLVRFTEMEYAIPRERAAEALERVLATVERRRLPVGFPIELRVVAPDDALLSTAYERPTAYIAVHQYRGMEFESYFRAVEAIMDDYGGRPHWGKRHYQTAATLAPRYPEWGRFAELRRRFDPEGRFENDYLRRVLGPVAA
ncbi:MAG TPA: D-arabinono-1,4-lactone oxidase [Thermoleophilaceae bacterium]|nr:D-arabinono-1,4-lactone oxidase [Thermoleophilaceae bacterium]